MGGLRNNRDEVLGTRRFAPHAALGVSGFWNPDLDFRIIAGRRLSPPSPRAYRRIDAPKRTWRAETTQPSQPETSSEIRVRTPGECFQGAWHEPCFTQAARSALEQSCRRR